MTMIMRTQAQRRSTTLVWATSIGFQTDKGLLTKEEAFLAGLEAAAEEGVLLLKVITDIQKNLVQYYQNQPTLRSLILYLYGLLESGELNHDHMSDNPIGETTTSAQ